MISGSGGTQAYLDHRRTHGSAALPRGEDHAGGEGGGGGEGWPGERSGGHGVSRTQAPAQVVRTGAGAQTQLVHPRHRQLVASHEVEVECVGVRGGV